MRKVSTEIKIKEDIKWALDLVRFYHAQIEKGLPIDIDDALLNIWARLDTTIENVNDHLKEV